MGETAAGFDGRTAVRRGLAFVALILVAALAVRGAFSA
jgi:hypothetical protein